MPLFTCLWDISDVRRTFALIMHRYVFHIAEMEAAYPCAQPCAHPNQQRGPTDAAEGRHGEGGEGEDGASPLAGGESEISGGSSPSEATDWGGVRGGRTYIKSLMVMIKGMNSLFWADLNSLSSRFQPVFAFLVDRLTDEKQR
jgi:hypothetical protein